MDDELEMTEGTRLELIRTFAESNGWTAYLMPYLQKRMENVKTGLAEEYSVEDTMKMRAEYRVLKELLEMPGRDIAALNHQARKRHLPDAGGMQ